MTDLPADLSSEDSAAGGTKNSVNGEEIHLHPKYPDIRPYE